MPQNTGSCSIVTYSAPRASWLTYTVAPKKYCGEMPNPRGWQIEAGKAFLVAVHFQDIRLFLLPINA